MNHAHTNNVILPAIQYHTIPELFLVASGLVVRVLGPNLQNLVKYTYENVTRELRIVL